MFGYYSLSSFLSSRFRCFCDELKSFHCGTRGVRVACGAKCHLWQILHRNGTKSVPCCSFSRVASSWGESTQTTKDERCECATYLLPLIDESMPNADYCSTRSLSPLVISQSCTCIAASESSHTDVLFVDPTRLNACRAAVPPASFGHN